MKTNLQKQNIAVFCGSDMGKKTAFCEAAEELGKWIGKNKDDYYAPLKRMFDEMEQAGFWWKDSRKHVLFSENFEEIERFITAEDRK